MKQVHDRNLSFWSPQPYFIGAFFTPQQFVQIAWLYRLWKLDEKKPAEKKELDEIVRFVPYYAIGNACIGTWMFFWNSERLDISNIFVTINTFTQLFFATESGSAWTKLAPVKIEDKPKFAHRGLNLDVSRHFMAVDDIKRTIDALSFNKFNRLHLHVTDAQAWPLEIPAIPELSAKGAYRPDMVYTVDDFEDLQTYSALQGVQLITEIDSPGHTSSVAYSHPDLIAAFDVQPDWGSNAAEPPSGTLKLNSTDVYKFMKTVYDDLLPRTKPFSSYFHSGGDEVKAAAYKLDDTVNSGDVKVLTPLLQKFVNKLHGHIRKQGLVPMVWEEMLLEWGLDLGKDVVVQTWQSDQALLQTVNKGYKALAGNYNYWYLDCGRGQWLDFMPKDAPDFWPFKDYCDPLKNWRLIYSYDPLHGIPEDKQDLVIGGEVHLWNEQTDPINLDGKLWPRAAAAGEVLWSGAKDGSGKNRSQVLASPRLSEMRERLVAKGVAAEPIHMPYCLMYPKSCVYHP